MLRLEDVKRAMLAVLRERIPYYLNFHYDKKMNLNDYTLTVGAGLSGLLFRCSWNNAKSLAFVELYFEKQRINWYESFLQHKQSIQNKVHPDIQFDNRKIGIYFEPMDSLFETFEMIAEVFEKFILFFCPYTYGVNDVLQCLDLDGANCPKTDVFTVQNEEEAILCSPFILQIYLIRFIFLKIKFYFISASHDIPV
ncbi:hypothetical protein M3212_21670, partial [Alkalihalobacillus oceani]|uniref:hypothetical protein n=1 Tax=Halalkalibacter oceani TaxID=1653776 RepID=UPI00203E85A4